MNRFCTNLTHTLIVNYNAISYFFITISHQNQVPKTKTFFKLLTDITYLTNRFPSNFAHMSIVDYNVNSYFLMTIPHQNQAPKTKHSVTFLTETTHITNHFLLEFGTQFHCRGQYNIQSSKYISFRNVPTIL